MGTMHTIPSSTSDEELELEVAQFRDTARRFVKGEFVPNEARWAKQQHVDRKTWQQAGSLGLLLADIPEEYGGSGGTFRHQAAVADELAQSESSTGFLVHSIVAHYVLNHGTKAQRSKYLPLLASGEMIGAIAMTEPGTGSDLQAIRTKAVLDGEWLILNGSKTFITNGSLADLVIVVARTGDGLGGKGLSLVLLETRGAMGFRVGRVLDKIGQHTQDTSELFLEDVRVPADAVLGGERELGFKQLKTELPYERVLLGLAAVSATERAVRLTVDYVKEREAFGKKLMEFQNTRFVLAEAKTHAVIARTFINHCIALQSAGKLDTTTASMLKWWSTDLQCKVVDECVQLFGGYGYMAEYPIARMYADARVQRIYGGTNEIMKELIARSL
jgi:acyl-CoA dehydrogenase